MEYVSAQGVSVPALGFGTWQLRGEDCRAGVRHALELGYRHLDTARVYRNEVEVGEGIRASGADRGEIFLVTKIPGQLPRDEVRSDVEASLRDLGTDYVDLLLIHQPSRRAPLAETLAAMRTEQEAGRVRHLGVSNFSAAQLEEALTHAPILTNQVEYHPGRRQDAVLAVARRRDVFVTAYSPLGIGALVGQPTLEEVGARHGKSSAQVAIRWLLQQPGVATIPRSSNPDHRAENLDVFDFSLDDDEMELIGGLAAA